MAKESHPFCNAEFTQRFLHALRAALRDDPLFLCTCVSSVQVLPEGGAAPQHLWEDVSTAASLADAVQQQVVLHAPILCCQEKRVTYAKHALQSTLLDNYVHVHTHTSKNNYRHPSVAPALAHSKQTLRGQLAP